MPAARGYLSDWVDDVNTSFDLKRFYAQLIVELNKAKGVQGTKRRVFELDINIDKAKVPFDELFSRDILAKPELDYRMGTVHSVKGETFEAVLLCLGRKAGNNSLYENLLKKNFDKLNDREKEELRIVYVGITRPRKLLVIAVPSEKDKTFRRRCKLSGRQYLR
jgi:DNA helicase-2/ATP-dependent DNA helicase PcrA